MRTTIRSLKRKKNVLDMLKVAGVEPGERLTFFVADLLSDDGWTEAVSGCEYVQHVASPFPLEIPHDESVLIKPAVEGTLRVLRFSRDAGVKRVVVTSSTMAIDNGHPPAAKPFDETDWTNLEGHSVPPYPKSKTLAERAAWDFMATEGGSMEMSVVNPCGVFGPVLGPDISTSISLVKMMMSGEMPMLPRVSFPIVDVRDVADLHFRAMTDPVAKGERFIAAAGNLMWFQEIAKVLKDKMGPNGRKVSVRQVPNWMVHIMALFDPKAKSILSDLSAEKNLSHEKASRILGWAPKSNEEALLATAESLVRLELVKA